MYIHAINDYFNYSYNFLISTISLLYCNMAYMVYICMHISITYRNVHLWMFNMWAADIIF